MGVEAERKEADGVYSRCQESREEVDSANLAATVICICKARAGYGAEGWGLGSRIGYTY